MVENEIFLKLKLKGSIYWKQNSGIIGQDTRSEGGDRKFKTNARVITPESSLVRRWGERGSQKETEGAGSERKSAGRSTNEGDRVDIRLKRYARIRAGGVLDASLVTFHARRHCNSSHNKTIPNGQKGIKWSHDWRLNENVRRTPGKDALRGDKKRGRSVAGRRAMVPMAQACHGVWRYWNQNHLTSIDIILMHPIRDGIEDSRVSYVTGTTVPEKIFRSRKIPENSHGNPHKVASIVGDDWQLFKFELFVNCHGTIDD